MTDDKGQLLSDFVHISRHYQRSIRVDADLGRLDALTGYICHSTATSILENMARQVTETNQRSFTWTGPFGGGKSSLAVTLASALHHDKKLRIHARNALKLESMPAFDKAFPTRKGWLVVPVVGKRTSVIAELNAALRKAKGKGTDNRKISPTSLINELCQTAEDRSQDGVLVILDEMGKFLEASALGHGDDVYFFQELAEAAARTNGKLVVVGVLHQSFAQYGARLGTDTRDEWAKVQGRYIDLPFVAASDEVVELIGRAIEAERPDWVLDASNTIADSIRSRRPAVGARFADALATCWPLHPAMAALLGPISKRQFGQNERSTFGFLASVEPHGFHSYLQATPIKAATWYRPDNYWDYLRSNLEPAILASPDGHRWSQAVEAIERTEAKTVNPFLVELIKNIAVIDLFRNGSGLAADMAVLGAIFYKRPIAEIEKGLEELARMRVALFKKHISAWSVFEGSDFDIDAAIAKTLATSPGVDYNHLAHLMGLHPVVAKRHYHETGTMRWMNLSLSKLEDAERVAEKYTPAKGEFGMFALALPGRGIGAKVAQRRAQESSRLSPWPVLIGIPRNHARIEELGTELVALEAVKDRHELQGDAVARREVHARLAAIKANLEEQLQVAVTSAQWFDGSDEAIEAGARLSPIASNLADDLYPDAPLVWSELVNRDSVSSNSVKARRDLLHRMLSHEGVEHLGIEGFPAERGLYETLLRSTGLHREVSEGNWRFAPPNTESEARFAAIWQATRDMFVDSSARVKVTDILELWSAAPFGVKTGIQPVLIAAFLLAHQSNVAVYKDGMFIPRLTDADIDEYLQDAGRFSLRWVVIDEEKARILGGIANILAEVGHAAEARDPLEAARGLVALVFNLPLWTQRTHQLSDSARAIRDTLLKASDPHKVLFVDLVALLDTSDGDAYVKALRGPVAELAGAYEAMLRSVDSAMLEALDAPPAQHDRLRARAEAVAGITGDLRQDSFATRLAKYDGSTVSIEGILSLAANKPPRDWTDRDIDAATLEISKVALRFRQAEAFVSVKGRKPNSEAFAVVIGTGTGAKMISRSFDITDRHRLTVESKADEIATQLRKQGLGTDLLLAILAKAGMRLTADEEENHG